MKKKKTLLSYGATVVAFAIVLAPVNNALAAEKATERTATPSISEEATAPADVPATDEVTTAHPDPALVIEEPDAVEATAPNAVPEVPVQATPVENPRATAARAAAPLISTDGLTPIGTGVYQPSPAAPPVEYDRFMPSLHDAHISGVATPEGNRAPDEVELDLRSLVGITVQSPTEAWQESGFRYSADGALSARPDTGESVNVPGFSDRIDWTEFTFDVTALPRTYVASNADGKVRLIAFDQNSVYGVTVTLRHIATGITSAPITITGRSGVDGASSVAWVGNAPEVTFDGGIPMWAASDRAEWRDGHSLTWADPRETITPTGARTFTPSEPRLAIGQAPLGTPAGFGLTDYGNGPQTEQPSYRIGELTGEPTKTVTIDLADRISGVTAVALPSAENGTLVLPATGGLWVKDREFIGLDYNAPQGLTVSVSGTVVTFDFGSAEWLNAAGISGVPVRLADGTRATAEVRTESLPRDIAGGLVEKRIPVETELFISDTEMLAASRLTGLSPSMAEVQAAVLPEGVQRVANGFEYQGSAEPTELSFGFTVAETVETEFGPVRPDVAAPGEVGIAVVAGETPVTPEPEPTPETPTPAPSTPSVTPAQPQTPAVKPNPRFETGGAGPLVASENVSATGGSPALLTLGAAGGLGIVGLLSVLAARLFRRSES